MNKILKSIILLLFDHMAMNSPLRSPSKASRYIGDHLSIGDHARDFIVIFVSEFGK